MNIIRQYVNWPDDGESFEECQARTEAASIKKGCPLCGNPFQIKTEEWDIVCPNDECDFAYRLSDLDAEEGFLMAEIMIAFRKDNVEAYRPIERKEDAWEDEIAARMVYIQAGDAVVPFNPTNINLN